MSDDSHHMNKAYPGFTMMEIIVALSISTAVMLGVVSLLSLASNAVPQPGGIQETAVDGADLLARLTSDLACATQITQADAAAITLVVPDRTGDDIAETISYRWGAGVVDPIVREFNGTRTTDLLGNADLFVITYARATTAVAVELSKSTSASGVLQSNLATIPTVETLRSEDVIVVLEPVLGAANVVWTLESLSLYFQSEGKGNQNEIIQIDVRGCDGAGQPTGALYTRIMIDEDDMSTSLALHTLDVFGIIVPAGSRLCVVVKSSDGSGEVGVGTAGTLPVDASATTIANPLSLEATGTITSITGGPTTRSAITGVFVRIRAGEESWTEQMSLPIVNAAAIAPE